MGYARDTGLPCWCRAKCSVQIVEAALPFLKHMPDGWMFACGSRHWCHWRRQKIADFFQTRLGLTLRWNSQSEELCSWPRWRLQTEARAYQDTVLTLDKQRNWGTLSILYPNFEESNWPSESRGKPFSIGPRKPSFDFVRPCQSTSCERKCASDVNGIGPSIDVWYFCKLRSLTISCNLTLTVVCVPIENGRQCEVDCRST